MQRSRIYFFFTAVECFHHSCGCCAHGLCVSDESVCNEVFSSVTVIMSVRFLLLALW